MLTKQGFMRSLCATIGFAVGCVLVWAFGLPALLSVVGTVFFLVMWWGFSDDAD
jgi:threonine/homoserine/homoserine lactone efflux protein